VDVLDLEGKQLSSREFEVIAQTYPSNLVDLFATRDEATTWPALGENQPNTFCGMLSFERLLSATEFAPTMRELCHTLQRAYNYPVDIEFTANFTSDDRFRINLLQCRPFQVKIGGEGSR